MDTVKCPHCQAEVVPHLRRYNPGIFRYAKTKHVCRLCGEGMYETGGERNVFGKIVGWVLVYMLAQLICFFIPRPVGTFLSGLLQVAALSYALYRLVKFFWKKVKEL